MKKIFSGLFIVLGIVCYSGSIYIENQVAAGKIKLKKAQKNLDKADQALSLTPYTSPLGKGLKEASKDKIDEGKRQINYYSDLSETLKIGGYLLASLGCLGMFFSFKKNKP